MLFGICAGLLLSPVSFPVVMGSLLMPVTSVLVISLWFEGPIDTGVMLIWYLQWGQYLLGYFVVTTMVFLFFFIFLFSRKR